MDKIQSESGQTVGRVEETISGYVPVRTDIMGLDTERGPEFPFRVSAVEWLGGVE